jgi:ferric-dicitrate binding protein FerR (iron transport regulator)
MHDIIALVLSGEASDIEQRQLQRWRRESPENERTYREMEQLWELSAQQVSERQIRPPPPVDHIIAQAEARRAEVTPLRAKPLASSQLWRWTAVAAAAVVVLGVGVVSLRENPEAVFSTGPGQTSTLSLNDGSVVRLGPESRVQVWTESHRTVSLDGTAFFAVATDSLRPFVVRTDAGEAEVLGTRFELRASPDSLRLVVVDGLVALDAAGQRVEVGRGAMSRILIGSAPEPPRTADVWDLLEWSGGLLIFQSTPLSLVMAEVSNQFGVVVNVRDSVLAERSVTAWFEDETLEEVVFTVCQVVGASCTIGEVVEVTR